MDLAWRCEVVKKDGRLMDRKAGTRICYKAHGTASGMSQPTHHADDKLHGKRHCVSCSLRLRHVTREMKCLPGALKVFEERRSETKTGSWCVLFAYPIVLHRDGIL